MAITIVGFFDKLPDAHAAIEELVVSGHTLSDVGLVTNDDLDQPPGEVIGPSSSDGAASGAGRGAMIGGIAGLLVGLGAAAIPGVSWVAAAGPLATTLVGAGIGAAAGGVFGALVSIGMPEEEAQSYADGVRKGGALVSVNCAAETSDGAIDILSRHGGVDIHQMITNFSEGYPTWRDTSHQEREGTPNTGATDLDQHEAPPEPSRRSPYPGLSYDIDGMPAYNYPVSDREVLDEESELDEDPNLMPKTPVKW